MLRTGANRACAALLFIAVLLAVLLIPNSARADSSLSVTAIPTPDALKQADTIEVSVSVTNTSEDLLEDVTIVSNNINETLGNFESGLSKRYTIRNFKVADENIGDGVTFYFYWTENGEAQSTELFVPIALKVDEPELTAERTLSGNSAGANETITATYAVQNTGDLELFDITITDPALPSPISVGTLAPGSAVFRTTQEITLTADAVSAPVIDARLADGTTYTVSVEPTELKLTDAQLTLSVTKGEVTADGTKINISVQNPGNTDFTGVALTDETGTALTTAFALASLDEHTVEVTVNPQTTREFSVTATATYGTSGTPLIVTSDVLEIEPVLSGEDIVVTMIASPVKNKFDEPSEVAFAIRIDNDSPVELFDFAVSEESAGRLTTLDVLEKGTQTVNVSLLISQTRAVTFLATFADEYGNEYSVSANAVNITIDAAAPTTDVAADGNSGSGLLKWILIIIIVLFLAALLSLVYVITQNKKRKEQEREAEELDKMLAARQEQHRQDTARTPRPRVREADAEPIRPKAPQREPEAEPARPKAPQREQAPIQRRESTQQREAVRPERLKQQKASQDDIDSLFDDEFN